MSKQFITEAARLQKLAGINEIKPVAPITKEYVLGILNKNGVDDEYIDDMGGIESGTEKWFDIISDVIGRDYPLDDEDDNEDDLLTQEEHMKIIKFIDVMEKELGIEFI